MLNYPHRISLCGFGGQGIILSAVILGTTAVTKADLYAVQTQSYGSEARGGQCQAELIIQDKPINSPIAETKNLLVAMFQTAYEKYIDTLDEDGVLVIDPQLVTKIVRPIKHTLEIPATQIAVDMVVLGFLSEALDLMSRDAPFSVLESTVNPRFLELNIKAVDAGIAYAVDHDLYYRV